jgi:hypothetical protein
VLEVLLELDREKELHILVEPLVALDILHMLELGPVGMPLLLVVDFQVLSWHLLQNHRPALHILSSSSFRPQNVARWVVGDVGYSAVANKDRLADIRHEELPWLLREADLCRIAQKWCPMLKCSEWS